LFVLPGISALPRYSLLPETTHKKTSGPTFPSPSLV
jgi:hypothetical protein